MGNKDLNIEVKRWLIMAERFKNAANLCLTKGFSFEYSPQLPGAFLTASAIELYLKAFLFYKYASETKNITGIYAMLKKSSHDLKCILCKCVVYDNTFKELGIVIDPYKKYSTSRYPDELYKIIYDRDETIEISSTFIGDIEKVENFIKKRIPEETQKIKRHI